MVGKTSLEVNMGGLSIWHWFFFLLIVAGVWRLARLLRHPHAIQSWDDLKRQTKAGNPFPEYRFLKEREEKVGLTAEEAARLELVSGYCAAVTANANPNSPTNQWKRGGGRSPR